MNKVLRHFNQERIVFVLTLLLLVIFALTLPNFLAANNLLSLIRSVAVLGILGLGMLVVVLGRRKSLLKRCGFLDL